ncbi:MAG: pseudouridine-5'-phosphate glycosidase [Bacillota bacterium]|nr:pseudouridine-5'-phosphate glycosidase [Bacillota bacterium]
MSGEVQPTNRVVHVAPEVEEALRRGRPVVALESTLIAHGLPRPQNLEVARELEAVVRQEGAVPATIAVVAGVPTVGLEPAELERIARPDVPKLGVRDLPAAIALGSDGATTVASTAWLAAKAGIRLLATGGLGGVHRDARESWDESNDLVTLAQTPVAVVASGVKSILDVAATLERLETLGVLVVGWRTRRFPGFYVTDSGHALDWSVEDEGQAAALLAAQADLASESGVVVANPVPPEEQLDPALHERVLREALAELERRGIRGKAVTPFLLERFHEATGGESLRVNRLIVRRNARLAARIAVAWAELARRRLRP